MGISMAKYKKKKVGEIATTKAPAAALELTVAPKKAIADSSVDTSQKAPEDETASERKARKMASGSIKLQFAGDLVLVRNTQKPLSGLFKRYADLFEALANMDKDHRNLVYRFMTALMLTSHAKKATHVETKRKLFEHKNDLYVAMANERSLRRIFEFKYLVSKNFRVISYCDTCAKKNAEAGLDRHKWKYCKACNVDHNFYNLLSMEVKFPNGWARLFLSNDQIPRLKGFRIPRKVKAGDLSEEAMFDRYHYNSRNLDAIEIDSVLTLNAKLATQPLAIEMPQSEVDHRPIRVKRALAST